MIVRTQEELEIIEVKKMRSLFKYTGSNTVTKVVTNLSQEAKFIVLVTS